jgi:PAS domain-containing protein
MTVERNGYPEEAFFTGNFTPIRGSDGDIKGLYNALFEVTRQKIADRKTAMLNLISVPDDLTTESVCNHIMRCLETNPNDITMAIIYQVDDTSDAGQPTLHLSGHLGVPRDHPLLVGGDLKSSSEGLIPLCCRAQANQNGPFIIARNEMFNNLDWKGPAGPSNSIAVLPLMNGRRLFGFLIIGTNPRRLDNENAQLLSELALISSGVMASAVSTEEARLRNEKLERDLADSDLKIRHLVQHASVGMVHLSTDGGLKWANNFYWTITDLTPEEANEPFGCFNCTIDEDSPITTGEWQKLMEGHEVTSVEIRLKRWYKPVIGDPVPATVLVFAFPCFENGKVTSVMACLTDISRLKWAEAWQARLAEDAQDAKRQQEAFIDMVSHGMHSLSLYMDIIFAPSTHFEDRPLIHTSNLRDAQPLVGNCSLF